MDSLSLYYQIPSGAIRRALFKGKTLIHKLFSEHPLPGGGTLIPDLVTGLILEGISRSGRKVRIWIPADEVSEAVVEIDDEIGEPKVLEREPS